MVDLARRLICLNFEIVATSGTGRVLNAEGVEVEIINKVLEGRPHRGRHAEPRNPARV